MSAPPHLPICERCAERVGVYEPAVFELADGAVVDGSLLALAGERRREVVRAWHRECREGGRAAGAGG